MRRSTSEKDGSEKTGAIRVKRVAIVLAVGALLAAVVMAGAPMIWLIVATVAAIVALGADVLDQPACDRRPDERRPDRASTRRPLPA